MPIFCGMRHAPQSFNYGAWWSHSPLHVQMHQILPACLWAANGIRFGLGASIGTFQQAKVIKDACEIPRLDARPVLSSCAITAISAQVHGSKCLLSPVPSREASVTFEGIGISTIWVWLWQYTQIVLLQRCLSIHVCRLRCTDRLPAHICRLCRTSRWRSFSRCGSNLLSPVALAMVSTTRCP